MNQNDSADDPKQPPGGNAPGTSVDGLVGGAERLLRLAVDSTPNCVFIKDTEGRYRLVNPATGLVFGCSPASVLGRTDAELAASGVLTPETAQAFARNDRSVLEGGAPGAFIEPVRTPDGRIRWFETVKVPVASDGFKGILGVAVDVTELKEAEDALVRERDTARAYLDLAGTLIVAIRPDETVAMANRTACETLRQELVRELHPVEQARRGPRGFQEGHCRGLGGRRPLREPSPQPRRHDAPDRLAHHAPSRRCPPAWT